MKLFETQRKQGKLPEARENADDRGAGKCR